MKSVKVKSDVLGATSSALCLIHCLATPLLFFYSTSPFYNNNSKPLWWSSLDLVFITFSLIAIIQSIKITNLKFIKPLLAINWLVLFGLIINEKLEFFKIEEVYSYVFSFSLIVLHLYNVRHINTKQNGIV